MKRTSLSDETWMQVLLLKGMSIRPFYPNGRAQAKLKKGSPLTLPQSISKNILQKKQPQKAE